MQLWGGDGGKKEEEKRDGIPMFRPYEYEDG
jgi:hypothetical protein